jgi:LysR family hydrogen peroxide-inducible transcriptional activator
MPAWRSRPCTTSRSSRRCRSNHPLAAQTRSVTCRASSSSETMLLLGTGHCFPRPCARGMPRVCPLFRHGRGHTTQLRGFVAGNHQAHGGRRHGCDPGAAAVACRRRRLPGQPARRKDEEDPFIKYLPVTDASGGAPPTRRVVLAWRRSFTRYEAIAALRNAIYACELPGVSRPVLSGVVAVIERCTFSPSVISAGACP